MDQHDLEERLHAARPEPPAETLDRVRRRVVAAAAAPARRTRPMIVTVLLAFGLVSTASGGALAVSGLSAQGTAAQVQYPSAVAPNTAAPPQTLAGSDESRGDSGGDDGRGGVGSETIAQEAPSAQPGRQVQAAASEGELPLTGYLAIPTLLLGLGSLTAGLVIRRRTRAQ
jgi:hypothetical protein